MPFLPSLFYPGPETSNAKSFLRVARFYKPPPALVLDATFGAGEFWRNEQGTLMDPLTRYFLIGIDIVKRQGQTFLADCRHLPFRTDKFDLVIYDPPFGGGGGGVVDRFGRSYAWTDEDQSYGFSVSLKDLMLLTKAFDREAYRVLKPDGLLITKIMDLSGLWLHDEIERWLQDFKMIDLIVFAAVGHKILARHITESAKRSIKIHSYFQVWEKK